VLARLNFERCAVIVASDLRVLGVSESVITHFLFPLISKPFQVNPTSPPTCDQGSGANSATSIGFAFAAAILRFASSPDTATGGCGVGFMMTTGWF
jgi:hypothetical protein